MSHTITQVSYTEEQLRAAFEKVQNKDHWKNPIDAVILKEDIDVTATAIRVFTGTQPLFSSNRLTLEEVKKGYVRVTADGYYLGPCN